MCTSTNKRVCLSLCVFLCSIPHSALSAAMLNPDNAVDYPISENADQHCQPELSACSLLGTVQPAQGHVTVWSYDGEVDPTGTVDQFWLIMIWLFQDSAARGATYYGSILRALK
ncbi:hypothetical protein FQN55_006935 [Onygenales sp. PD_40]|nr:hypothetical protein FQN55_006935 [Onygenales sp. PD_40]